LVDAPEGTAVIVTVLPEAEAVTGEPEALSALANAVAMLDVLLTDP
jgi:hypothetical protein